MVSECLKERWSGWTQINPVEPPSVMSAGGNEGDIPNLNQSSGPCTIRVEQQYLLGLIYTPR